MQRYKITVAEVNPEEDKYWNKTIYEQTIEGLDIPAVIAVVNKLQKMDKSNETIPTNSI